VSSGPTPAIVITTVLAVLIAVFWIALPVLVKRRHAEPTGTEFERP
jgi:hypothetical protein